MPRTSLSEEERVERDARIAASTGTAAEIAAAEGCSVRTVRRVLAAVRAVGVEPVDDQPPTADGPVLLEVSPNRELVEVLQLHAWGVEQMRGVAKRTRSDALKIGAVKAATALSRERLAMLVAVGLIPQTRVGWDSEQAWSQVARMLAEDCHIHGIDLSAVVARAERYRREMILGHGDDNIRAADETEAIAA